MIASHTWDRSGAGHQRARTHCCKGQELGTVLDREPREALQERRPLVYPDGPGLTECDGHPTGIPAKQNSKDSGVSQLRFGAQIDSSVRSLTSDRDRNTFQSCSAIGASTHNEKSGAIRLPSIADWRTGDVYKLRLVKRDSRR